VRSLMAVLSAACFIAMLVLLWKSPATLNRISDAILGQSVSQASAPIGQPEERPAEKPAPRKPSKSVPGPSKPQTTGLDTVMVVVPKERTKRRKRGGPRLRYRPLRSGNAAGIAGQLRRRRIASNTSMFPNPGECSPLTSMIYDIAACIRGRVLRPNDSASFVSCCCRSATKVHQQYDGVHNSGAALVYLDTSENKDSSRKSVGRSASAIRAHSPSLQSDFQSD